MTRELVFDGLRAPTRFLLLRTALLSGGDGKGDRGRATVRKEARLLDALDRISDLAPVKDDAEARVLKPDGGTLVISQEDFDLLSGYLDSTPWLPRAARDAVDVQDWFSAAAKVEPV